MNIRRLFLKRALAVITLAALLGMFPSSCYLADPDDDKDMLIPANLINLSGMNWVEDDLFIAIHDAKRSDEEDRWPRVSLLQLPTEELEGVKWKSVELQFPGPGGLSSDLESSCSIPGGKAFLFVESGQDGEGYQRIFYAEYNDGSVFIPSYINWPVAVENVEATEVCQVGQQLVFLYAERAQGLSSTSLRWANLSLTPLAIGEFQEVVYEAVDPVGPDTRPIVALEIDSDGFIYIVSTYDSGDDQGPFRSVVWRIGQIKADGQGNTVVVLGDSKRLATLDGLKVESLAIRETTEHGKQVYFGTDDEFYGGILRLLPAVE